MKKVKTIMRETMHTLGMVEISTNKPSHRKTTHWLRQNARVFRCLGRYKAKMKISVVFILLAFSSFNLNAITFNNGISNKSFERMCKEELEARNKDEFHMSFCISYLIGFIDGANNPKGCNMQDSSALVMRYIAFSEKVKTAYFGDTVRAFVSSGCNAL
jgi:hypothetical protein